MMRIQRFLLILLVLLTLTACEKSSKKVEVPDNEILAISRYQNYAYGYQDSGTFICSDGNVYSFNFSQYTYRKDSDNSEEAFLEKLKRIMEYAEPFAVINKQDMQSLYSYSQEIDVNDKCKTKNVAFDAGSDTLQFQNVSADKFILCRESGDYKGELKSKAGRVLLDFYDNTILPEISEATDSKQAYYQNYLYTDEDINIYNIHCGYTGKQGLYIYNIEGKDDVQKIKEATGIDLNDFQWNGNFPSEHYVYIIKIEDVSNVGYDLKSNAVLIRNENVTFLRSPDSKVPEEGKEYGQAMDGFCFIAEVPKSAIATISN